MTSAAQTETYNNLYLIGIILSFIVGFVGLWIGIGNSRKTIFINSITTSRIKYIQDLRNYLSEFCGLIFTYNTEYLKFERNKENNRQLLFEKELLDIKKKIDNLKYLIRLHLNLEDVYFDTPIIKLIDEIIELSDLDPKDKIEELIILSQFLLKLEWEGAKLESSIGIVSKRRKNTLYKTFSRKHEKYWRSKRKDNDNK